MPAIVQRPHTKSFHSGLNDFALEEIRSAIIPSVSAPVSLRRGDRVIHKRLGFGRVVHAGSGSNDEVTICFDDGQRTVSPRSLRRLLPRTVVAQLIERTTSNVSGGWCARRMNRAPLSRMSGDASPGTLCTITMRHEFLV